MASGNRERTRPRARSENDDRADWSEAWALFPGDVAYVWQGAGTGRMVAPASADNGFACVADHLGQEQLRHRAR
jgi:hypothetical protein